MSRTHTNDDFHFCQCGTLIRKGEVWCMDPEEHYRGILETRDAMHRQSLVPRLRDARYVGQEMRSEAAEEIERLREEVADWKDRYESAKRDHEAEIKDIEGYYRNARD